MKDIKKAGIIPKFRDLSLVEFAEKYKIKDMEYPAYHVDLMDEDLLKSMDDVHVIFKPEEDREAMRFEKNKWVFEERKWMAGPLAETWEPGIKSTSPGHDRFNRKFMRFYYKCTFGFRRFFMGKWWKLWH